MAHHGTRAPRARLAALTLGALGVVYGDIGTSPLYAIREALGEQYGIDVTRTSVLGVLSLVFWALLLIVTIKYIGFVMRADNQGEGGILALTSLLPAGVAPWLVVVGIFGTALLYGDGAITPAISVLSAVEGLGIATSFFEPYVIPIAVVILVALFAVQRRGTGAVGAVFGPVMLIWFSVLGVLGVIQIVGEPSVLAAIDPRHAAEFFGDQPFAAFRSLGSVFLVVTGGEALYADMGHFGLRPIRLGWFGMVMPALLLNYFGQGALLLRSPELVDNPFYRMAPGWALLPLVALATMATVIASQALISGAFSLTLQAVQLGYSPRLGIDHTSAEARGQIYVASVNWALMVVCIGLVIGFGSSSALAAAYGIAVTATMVITSVLFYVVARRRWGWGPFKAGAPVAVFLAADLAFFGSNLLKVFQGGWFPLLVGVVVLTLMTTWKTGRRLVYQRLRRGEVPIEAVIRSLAAEPVDRVPGTAVYMFPDTGLAPPAFLVNLRANHVVHEDVVFLSVAVADVPRVPPAIRDRVYELGDGFHQVILKYGFMDEPDIPHTLQGLLAGVSFDREHTVYLLGRESVRSVPGKGMARWRERLFVLLHRNATSAADYFRLPADRVIEIGMRVEI